MRRAGRRGGEGRGGGGSDGGTVEAGEDSEEQLLMDSQNRGKVGEAVTQVVVSNTNHHMMPAGLVACVRCQTRSA